METRRTVHVRVNLFRKGMRNKGPPPATGGQTRGSGEVKATLRTIWDNMASLAKRVTDAERKATHNPIRTSFEERGTVHEDDHSNRLVKYDQATKTERQCRL